MDGVSRISVSVIERPARVRVAGPADREWLWDQLMMAAAENAMAPINETRVTGALDAMIAREKAVAGVIDGTSGFAGSIGLTFGQWWYSTEWHVEEMWCFVHPDYRRGAQNKGHAKALLQFAIWWADQVGLPLLMGVLSHKRTEGKIRLYERSIPMAGALFLHRPGVAA